MARNLLDTMGYRAGTPALVHAVPDDLADVFAAVTRTATTEVSWIAAFAIDAAALSAVAASVAPLYRRGGHLWICYPKLSGSIASDLSRDRGWEAIAAADLLGVAQIAVNEDWSALRFRYRDEIAKLTRKHAGKI